MSPEAKLLKLVRQYLVSKLSFDELGAWVEDQEPYWSTLSESSPERLLAGLTSLMAYEVWDGARPEAEAREIIRQEAASLVGVA
jgi:hypothetical protein